MYLGALVFGGCDEVGSVRGPLEVGDLHVWFVDVEVVVEELAGL